MRVMQLSDLSSADQLLAHVSRFHETTNRRRRRRRPCKPAAVVVARSSEWNKQLLHEYKI